MLLLGINGYRGIGNQDTAWTQKMGTGGGRAVGGAHRTTQHEARQIGLRDRASQTACALPSRVRYGSVVGICSKGPGAAAKREDGAARPQMLHFAPGQALRLTIRMGPYKSLPYYWFWHEEKG